MPKLEDVQLGVSVLTDTVMMGTIKDANTWKDKRDCTSDFCSALLTWIPPGNVRVIGSSAGKRYEIEVRELAPNLAYIDAALAKLGANKTGDGS